MKWFYNLSTVKKLALGFGACIILSTVMGLTAISRMGQIAANGQSIVDHSVAGLEMLGEINNAIKQFRIDESKHFLTTENSEQTKLEQEMDGFSTSLKKDFSEYEKIASSPETKAALEKVKANWEAYDQLHSKQVELGRAHEAKAAGEHFLKTATTFLAIQTAVGDLRELQSKDGAAMATASAKTYADARNTALTFLIASIIIGVSVAYIITKYIVGILNKVSGRLTTLNTVCLTNLGEAVEALARGDVTAKVKSETQQLDHDTKDEFGAMANNLNDMITTVQATIHAFEGAQDSLSQLLAQVRASSDGIASASNQVSSGNSDLAQRTEEQAASLEETASSMEEMTSTVRQNADNAKLANQLAAQAKQVAEDGGSVVSNAVGAMNEINAGSKRIADIVSVIDEIAFQTNLLALNAAVEAARVGEQGRGFAVVAAEVRSLAGRSATAAKEIKALVQDSAGKVEVGSELINESGNRLEEIVNAVKKVADVIAEITAASLEQAAGIEQVNKAITQMDQVTQQNAALVEEVSATSQSMTQTAQNMQQVVSRFQIDSKYLLSVQQVEFKPQQLAATGTDGRAPKPAAKSRAAKAKLTVVESEDGFGEF